MLYWCANTLPRRVPEQGPDNTEPTRLFEPVVRAGEETAMTNNSNTAAFFIEQELARGKQPNRLVHEQSPYLLQHAFNPVDWYPWGEEAFARARAEDRAVFLSIGYSTCHWCHVMARESFADPATAAILNRHFIAVKVDREERPDLDHLYMAAAQAMNGSAGWPLSVFLTPERQPFYAGTYFPPEPRHGLPGFRQLLLFIHDIWRDKRDKVMESAAVVTDHIRGTSPPQEPGGLDDALAEKAYSLISRDFDATHGGFGPPPKFPRPVLFNFLLHHHWRTGEQHALDMVLFSLRKMAAGGMYDQVGGGFHRYSVDGQWRVPHFEKMLYDQGQLALLYLAAYQAGQDPFHAEVAADILSYVLRGMTDPQGGFYSAEDADSADPENPEKHGEGLFYLWRETEIMQLLGPESGPLFCRHYGVKKEGNALDDPHGEFVGRNILHVTESLEETAAWAGATVAEVARDLKECRKKLLAARSRRPRPHLDDKIITSWNGLMISALARGFQVLGREEYRTAAVRAARFLLASLREEKTGALLRRYRSGKAGLAGQLDDYAFFSQALLDLYGATFDASWLREAEALTEKQIAIFHDDREGGFFDAPTGDDSVLFRMKAHYDGAEPTGNSVAAMNLLRLARFTDNGQWREMAEKTISAFAHHLREYPPILPQMLTALGLARRQPEQIVLAGAPEEEETRQLLSVIHRRFLPNALVLLADGGKNQDWLARRLPFLADIRRLDGRPTAYVCKDFRCSRPTGDPVELEEQLRMGEAAG